MKKILLLTIIISGLLFQAGICGSIEVTNAVVLDTPPKAKKWRCLYGNQKLIRQRNGACWCRK